MQIFVYSVALLLIAGALLRLSDRKLVFVLGIGSMLVLGPSVLFVAGILDWRTLLAHGPTVVGYSLAAIVGIGAHIVMVCGLSAALRCIIAVVRLTQRKKISARVETTLDKHLP